MYTRKEDGRKWLEKFTGCCLSRPVCRRKWARVLFARGVASRGALSRPFRAVGAKTDGFKLESSVLADKSGNITRNV